MNAFSTGICLATITAYENRAIGLVDYKLDEHGNRVYQWQNARFRFAGSELPDRLATMAEMWQIARFLDNRGSVVSRNESAMAQLAAYALIAVALFRQYNALQAAA